MMSFRFEAGMSRGQKREIEAKRVAYQVLDEYGPDRESYEDRLLAICHGQQWLARAVWWEIEHMTGRARQARQQHRRAA